MKPKFHVKKGDTVKVISGARKGTTGVIMKMLTDKSRAIVEGETIPMVKKSSKPTAKFPDGGIVEIARTFHVSNLMIIDPATGEASRVGKKIDDKTGKKVRYSKKTGNIIPDNNLPK